jgi:protein gp37
LTVAGRTSIGWTDATLNLLSWRCAPVISECLNCYTEAFTNRWQGAGAFRSGAPELKPGRLLLPWLDLALREAYRIFLVSMSDPCHPGIGLRAQTLIWAMMAADPAHQYQVLTKRPHIARKLLTRADFPALVRAAIPDLIRALTPPSGRLSPRRREAVAAIEQAADAFTWPLRNVHLGVSAGQQSTADRFVPVLLDTPAARHILSWEPGLAATDLSPYLKGGDGAAALDWVIVGGESGRVHRTDPLQPADGCVRPMRLDWARSIVEQCRQTATPVWVKQLGSAQAHLLGLGDFKGEDWDQWPPALADLKIRQHTTAAELEVVSSARL